MGAILEQVMAASQQLHESQQALCALARRASAALRAVGLRADDELYELPEAAVKIIFAPNRGGWSVNRRQEGGVKVGTLESVLEAELVRLRAEIDKCEGMGRTLMQIAPEKG